MIRAAIILLASIAAITSASAQPASHQGHRRPAGQAAPEAAPYAGLQDRRIKTLSEVQETDLRLGRGMGLALAAELNGYPGPLHVLEHAEALGLTPAQRSTAEALRNRMTTDAQAIGARLLLLEEELDALFRSQRADTGQLAAVTAALGALTGRLREIHLITHIAMRDTLDGTQRETYARLRGYTVPR